MRCNDFKAIWNVFADEALTEDMHGEAASHVGNCDSCRLWDLRMRALESALEEAGEETYEAPPFLATRIMARLEDSSVGLLERLAAVFAPRRLVAATLLLAAFATGMLTMDAVRSKKDVVRAVASRVVLEFEAPGAEKVGLVGDFNQWGKKELPIASKNNDGKWVFELELTPGRYQYAFEVNGKKWLPDPRAKGIIPDGFGGINSVLYIPAKAGLETM